MAAVPHEIKVVIGAPSACLTDITLVMLAISDFTLEFLASLEYPWKEIKAIVAKIAKIVITIINSTRVNHFVFVLFTIIKKL